MARIVLKEMTLRRGIVVLPIHDSFIVQASSADLLVTTMADAFEQVSAAQRKAVESEAPIEDVKERLDPFCLVNESQSYEGKPSQTHYRGVGDGRPLPEAPFSVGGGSIITPPTPPVAVSVRGSVAGFARPNPSVPSVPSPPASCAGGRPSSDRLKRFLDYDELDDLIPY